MVWTSRKAFRLTDQEKLDRFWLRVRVGSAIECWEWTGPTTAKGYGQTTTVAGEDRAHRVAWLAAVGPIPAGMWVLHVCDNRLCVNPAHLFLGSHNDNMADMKAKGRAYRGGPKPKVLA